VNESESRDTFDLEFFRAAGKRGGEKGGKVKGKKKRRSKKHYREISKAGVLARKKNRELKKAQQEMGL